MTWEGHMRAVPLRFLCLAYKNPWEGEGLPQMAGTGGSGLGRSTDGDSRWMSESTRCPWVASGVAEILKGAVGALELLIFHLGKHIQSKLLPLRSRERQKVP